MGVPISAYILSQAIKNAFPSGVAPYISWQYNPLSYNHTEYTHEQIMGSVLKYRGSGSHTASSSDLASLLDANHGKKDFLR